MTLHFLVRPEWNGKENLWVAQCLEYDLTAQADKLADIESQIQQEIVGRFVIAAKLKTKPFEGIKPAPAGYWRQFDTAIRLELESTKARPFRPNSEWAMTPAFEARVFA